MNCGKVMKNSDKIINIGIFAHVDAGKTTLTEQLLLASGKIRQAGSVDSGTASTDFLSVEKERGISVNAACTHLSWRDFQINIIDTPGHIDFAGETERSLIALDGAVLVVSAVEGVQSHTENLWQAFRALNIPCIVLINKIDRVGCDINRVLDELSELDGFVPLLICAAEKTGTRECTVKKQFPDSVSLTEILAEQNDSVAESYINGETLSAKVLEDAFRQAVHSGDITPVLLGSSLLSVGITDLLDALITYLPPASKKECEELSGVIFKIEHDKSMGKIAHMRLFGGKIENREPLSLNGDIDREGVERAPQKITQIRKFNGARYVDKGALYAGDIAAICGLGRAKVFDTVGSCSLPDAYRLANPYLTVKLTPSDPSELTALVNAVKELSDEDPLINYKWVSGEREINISITGEIQRQIIEVLLVLRYNLKVSFSTPSVIYKETPAKNGCGFEAYTMPKPCWAVVKLGIEPLARGSGVVFDPGNVPHNKLFYKYQSHIKSSFFDSLEQGNYGWELTDMKVTLLDGEHHTVHTHPLDFFVATPMALMDGIRNTGTTLLEPMLNVKITISSEFLGQVISDITMMRGELFDTLVKKDNCIITARLPVATTLNYPIRLAALSGGRAIYSTHFGGYKECPLELGARAERRGINPLDRAKWILYARGAIQ